MRVTPVNAAPEINEDPEQAVSKTDWQLIQSFVATADQDAFTAIVRRHINLVHSAALRQVGRLDLAQDVSQVVFLLLARKARTFTPEIILSGWLIRTTRFASANLMKSEFRRQRCEHDAFPESNVSDTNECVWEQIAPQLDDALTRLNEKDRNALALRFFENKSLREVGAAMNLTEDAAKKRVLRAVEKLRSFFSRRSIRVSSLALLTALPIQAVQASSAQVTETVIASVLKSSPISAAIRAALESTETLLKKQLLYSILKSSALLCAVLAVLTGGSMWYSTRNAVAGQSPKETLRLQKQFLQSGDGERFVQLLDLRTPDERELASTLKRVVRTQHRLKSALRNRFGNAVGLAPFPFPLDEASERDLQNATVAQQGTTATLTWARGTSLRFTQVDGGWKSGFYRPPNRSVRQMISSYEKIAEAMDATALDVERGQYSSIREAQESFANRRR